MLCLITKNNLDGFSLTDFIPLRVLSQTNFFEAQIASIENFNTWQLFESFS